jgi:probable F420-dependent oxidoreductase
VKFAVTFGRMHPRLWVEAAEAADRLGFESAWLPEHLVLPVAMSGSPHAGAEHPPVPPTTQLFDPASYLSFLAARTTTLRVGTYVYLLGLRHPFVTARAFATLDWVSGGRAVIGAGAGWLHEEWRALGIDPATRGARLNEAITVCRRLWTEPTVANDGPCFPFDEVAFEPKPVQQPIPILIGGESAPALRRAGQLGDGWIGMSHTPESAAAAVVVIRGHRKGPAGWVSPSRSAWVASAPARTTWRPGPTPGWTESSCRPGAAPPRCSVRWRRSRRATSAPARPELHRRYELQMIAWGSV